MKNCHFDQWSQKRSWFIVLPLRSTAIVLVGIVRFWLSCGVSVVAHRVVEAFEYHELARAPPRNQASMRSSRSHGLCKGRTVKTSSSRLLAPFFSSPPFWYRQHIVCVLCGGGRSHPSWHTLILSLCFSAGPIWINTWNRAFQGCRFDYGRRRLCGPRGAGSGAGGGKFPRIPRVCPGRNTMNARSHMSVLTNRCRPGVPISSQSCCFLVELVDNRCSLGWFIYIYIYKIPLRSESSPWG